MRAVLLALAVLASGAALAADPLQTDPDKYTLVLENERVRVLRYHDTPGTRTQQHAHPDLVLHALSAFKRRLTLADGRTVEKELKAGETIYLPAQVHIGENVGTTDTDALLTELKGGTPAQPGAPKTGRKPATPAKPPAGPR